MNYVIGLDIGTSSVKGVLMDENKNIIATETVKHKYYYENNLKLLNADEFCDGCISAIKLLASKACGKVLGICASGASGNLMLFGKKNSPIYNWQNSFDKDIVDKYLGSYDTPEMRKIVGWGKNYGFPLATLAYLKATSPECIENADMICMSIEYLNYTLTGKWGITRSMGTPFYLINQETGRYHKDFLDIIGITEDKLPAIMDNCSVLGCLTKQAAQKTGLTEDTKVILGTFDHPAAARGAAVFDEGEVLLSCGTSWVALVPFKTRNEPLKRSMLIDPFMSPNGNWCGMRSIASISDKIDACKNKYFPDMPYREFDMLVDKSELGAGGIKVDLDCPADMPVDTPSHHLARAIAEAAANKLCDMLVSLDINIKKVKFVGGISKSKEWLAVINEVCNVAVEVVNGECAGAAGSALMARVGVGMSGSERD